MWSIRGMQSVKSNLFVKSALIIALVGLLSVIGTGLVFFEQDPADEPVILLPQEYKLVHTQSATHSPAPNLQAEESHEEINSAADTEHRNERIALESYAIKANAELKKHTTCIGKFKTLAFKVTDQGFLLVLQDSRAAGIYEPGSGVLTSAATDILRHTSQYVLPFQNKLELLVFSKKEANVETQTTLELSNARALAIYQQLRSAGIPDNRITLVGSYTEPIVSLPEFSADFSEQVGIVMRFTDFSHTKTKSREEQVKDLFAEFDKRRSVPHNKSNSRSAVANDTNSTTQHKQTAPPQTAVTKTKPHAPIQPIAPKDKIFGSDPLFGPADPL